ncbi:MAG: hypothetical protein ACRYG4_01455 [Janthinobacterium lividum]
MAARLFPGDGDAIRGIGGFVQTGQGQSIMSEPEAPLRQQIAAAIDAIRQQLAVLRSGPSIGGPLDNRSVIADLEAELAALEEARTNLGPHDR